MTTRGDFVTQVRSELSRKNLSAGTITQFMNQAIEHYKHKRFVFNVTLNETIGAASGSYILSAGAFSTSLIEMDDLILRWPSGSNHREPITHRPLQWVNRQRSTVDYKAAPDYYAIYGNTVIFNTVMDQSYDFEASFHKELSSMTSDNMQNAWINEGLELIKVRTKRLVLSQFVRGQDAREEAKDLYMWEQDTYRDMRRRVTALESTGRFLPSGPGVPVRTRRE